MLFKLLLPYFRFSLDSLDFLSPFGRTIFSRAQRVGDDVPVSVFIRGTYLLPLITLIYTEPRIYVSCIRVNL